MLTWVRAHGGVIPAGAVAHGKEANGEPLFVCRVTIADGSIHPGKIRPAYGGAHIPLGGNEVMYPDYEVLIGQAVWHAGTLLGPKIPEGAMVAGHEGPSMGNAVLYAIRAPGTGESSRANSMLSTTTATYRMTAKKWKSHSMRFCSGRDDGLSTGHAPLNVAARRGFT